MEWGSLRGVGRRPLLALSGLAAAGVPLVKVGEPAARRPVEDYERFVARLAAEDRFSGVVMLAHKGRTVLSRAYGMADRERGIRNHEATAFNLASASQPFLAVAVLQLMQQGRLALSDTVGRHLSGLRPEIAEKVTIHHVLTGTSGMDAPMPDWRHVYRSREEVRRHHVQWARQATLAGVPGSGSNGHLPGAGVGLSMAAQIVEALSGLTFWDYVHRNVFDRSGMRGSGFYTRTQWLADERIAHPYMLQADGRLVDAVRNLDLGSVNPNILGRNPGRAFIGYASGDGFVTAPDLVRFAEALRTGTVLDRVHAGLFAGAKLPGPVATSFDGYTMPIHITEGQWVFGRGGGGPGVGANWNVYPDTGWVGVVLSNSDNSALLEILEKEAEVVTGAPAAAAAVR
ncbi:beta-lactamase family protein [Actinoplanes sp. LDG1-06]|uniref:Beta-lactamase family protein n=1 Tax=Paractinoplanes ovalisporus TaxID=2810368 RepID=A0ABS2AF85_9ACTN|nr:serine hydrolase domain-containing protein [Actinoplanes ovalisporus]MBM2618492.1 beta-lactamase family protein [Actinoplanes ovalisporus]